MGPPASHGVSRHPCYSGNPLNGEHRLSRTGLSPCIVDLSRSFRWPRLCNSSRPRNPGPKPGLGYVRFRSPLLTESRLISFPPGTEMFQFPGSALTRYEFTRQSHRLCSDAGFPHSEISGSTLVCQLPGAYRRLPRLSSPLDAKASTAHPYELDHINESLSSRSAIHNGSRRRKPPTANQVFP